MTMIILPGGQFAEKGLVLNLPVHVNTVLDQVLPFSESPCACVVHFEAGKPKPSSVKYVLDTENVLQAFRWLQKNNPLYHDLSFTSFNGIECQINSNSVDCDESPSMGSAELFKNIDNLEEISMTRNGPAPARVYILLSTRFLRFHLKIEM